MYVVQATGVSFRDLVRNIPTYLPAVPKSCSIGIHRRLHEEEVVGVLSLSRLSVEGVSGVVWGFGGGNRNK